MNSRVARRSPWRRGRRLEGPGTPRRAFAPCHSAAEQSGAGGGAFAARAARHGRARSPDGNSSSAGRATTRSTLTTARRTPSTAGSGHDVVDADKHDVVAKNCEVVRRR